MPIIVPKDIPASKILQSENIFVMNDKRAKNQDIRPLEIAIVNLTVTAQGLAREKRSICVDIFN